MARINLLPWREELRKRRKREFGVATAVAVILTVCAMVGVHALIALFIDHQQERNSYLKQEIATLDGILKEIKDLEKTRENLLARMEIIQQLQHSRPEIVHMFDELVATIPEGMYLIKVDHRGRNLAISGRAESNARVSSYMRNLESSGWLGKPDLKVIESKEKTTTGLSHFELNAQQLAKVVEGAGRVEGAKR